MTDTPTGPSREWVTYIRSLKMRIDAWLASALAGGLVLSALYGAAAGAKGTAVPLWASLLGMLIALSVAGGAMAVGAMAGFLFGLPRALTSGEVRELARLNSGGTTEAEARGGARPGRAAEGAAANADQQSSGGGFGANTNLERISDWLTTIIVGIGIANVAALPGAIDGFGVRVDPYFTFGGHAFGIGAGLYCLIFGFLLSYISTRTKLMLIFTENERDKQSVQDGALSSLNEAVSAALEQSPLASAPATPAVPLEAAPGAAPLPAPPRPEPPQPSKADQLVLESVSLSTEQTPEQMLAVANASARTGDFAKALVLYQEYRRISAFDVRIACDFAGVLGMNGDINALDGLRSEFSQQNAAAEFSKAERNFVQGLRAALQANLYNGRYEDSIRLGQVLLARYPNDADAWAHLWLACAYGQRHASLKQMGIEGEVEQSTRAEAVKEVRRAIEADEGMRGYAATLYVPGRALGGDCDLASLHPDPDLDALLGVEPPAPSPRAPAAARRRARR